MKDNQAPQTIRLADYQAPDYLIDTVSLNVSLYEDYTEVTAQLEIRANPAVNDALQRPLVLNGVDIELQSLSLDEQVVEPERYQIDAESLSLPGVPAKFTLTVKNHIHPQKNTSLEGLYKSRGMFCTQCEPEGFRKITYYIDRPDVMARFTTRVEADRQQFPILLSNGNPVARGDAEQPGRHFVVWEDPFSKPCYLFALVAGDLAVQEDRFTTCSGREVLLQIFVEAHDLDKCDHAMQSLQNAMKWDEQVYGREYDLDIYMIVAVSHFNMGAMENKGLNIFNTSTVLAKAETTTDMGFARVESVIAHEYFHNWSGNRVTCRDWFQLSLKEGFTVLRDQQFSADHGSPTVKRIEEVNVLRTSQFAEDAGPMAHPVRPDSYIEINNFYTVTIYEKGAEIVRMLANMTGPQGFRAGTDLYFDRHDGQAVTCDDFVNAIETANSIDLTQFRRWYSQAGTPRVTASGVYDPQEMRYTLTLEQMTPSTPGQPLESKLPLHIPVAMGLLGSAGQALPLRVAGLVDGELNTVLPLRNARQQFVFEGVAEVPVPSLLRGFSAPVKLMLELDDAQLVLLMSHDSDGFNRWSASQQLTFNELVRFLTALENHQQVVLNPVLVDAFRRLLEDDSLDKAMVARMFELPSETYVAEQFETSDPQRIHLARESLRRQLAEALEATLWSVYHSIPVGGAYHYKDTEVAKRSLRNICLSYLMSLGSHQAYAASLLQYQSATHMTDQIAALRAVAHSDHPQRETVLNQFYQQWHHEALVVDQWFNVQATAPRSNILQELAHLRSHPAFEITSPNKVRALIGAFAMANSAGFHQENGAGYAFLAEQVIALNDINPQVAARMVVALTRWRRYSSPFREHMRSALQRVSEHSLSPDVFEQVNKSLKAD